MTKRRIFWRILLSVIILMLGALTAYAIIWYRHFTHHVTRQEISHEVTRANFEIKLRQTSPFTLQLFQQANANNQPVVLFTSGDGGLSPFCADVAAHIAAAGYTVIVFNAKDYLTTFANSQKPVAEQELIRDYETLVDESLKRPGVSDKSKVILAGWSLGAGFSVLAASDLDLAKQIDRIVAISLPIYNELAWKPTDALIYLTHGVPHEKVFDARVFLKKINSTPVMLINAADDDTSPLTEAKSLFAAAIGPKQLYIIKASGHHFEGGETSFYQNLDQSLGLNQRQSSLSDAPGKS